MLEDLLRSTPTEVEAEYLPGFFVSFRYVSNPEIERVVQAQKGTFRAGKIEMKGFTDAMRMAVAGGIIGWRGLTKANLLKMDLDLDLEKLEKAEFEELSCTQDTKLLLLKADAPFFEWVQGICTEIATMRDMKAEKEAKNSLTLPSGPSGQD